MGQALLLAAEMTGDDAVWVVVAFAATLSAEWFVSRFDYAKAKGAPPSFRPNENGGVANSGKSQENWRDKLQIEPPPGTPAEFMVVDDEPVLAEVLTSILNLNGYPCIPAYDGDEAVEKARLLRPKFILMGVVMPRMNGVEAAIAISKEQPECCICLFSGSAHAADLLNDALSKGYEFPLFPKPMHPTFLFSKLAEFGFRPRNQPSS